MSDENDNQNADDEAAMAAEWESALEEQGDDSSVDDAWAQAMAEQGGEDDDVSPVALSELQDESGGPVS